MQSSRLKNEHLKRLEGYGIKNMILDAGLCLRFKAGETIFNEGMPISYFLIVVKGRAKVCTFA